MDLIRVGAFDLYPSERQLCAGGKPLELGARAFDLLLVLVENPGRLVTKATLLERVWPRLVVDENNLPAQIAALRRVLGAERHPHGAWLRLPSRTGSLAPAACCSGAAAAADYSAATADTTAQLAAPSRTAGRARRRSCAEVQEALERSCLVSIVGIAGVGKTRLAQEVLAREAEKGRDWPPRGCRCAPWRLPSTCPRRSRWRWACRCRMTAMTSPRSGTRCTASRCCWCSTAPSTSATPWPPRWRSCCRRRAACACWLPARRRSGSPAKSSTGSPRCRRPDSGRRAGDRGAVRLRCPVRAACRSGRPLASSSRQPTPRWWRRSAAGSMAFHWPWNWLPRACRHSGWPRCWNGWMTASACCARPDARAMLATAHCIPHSTGVTIC